MPLFSRIRAALLALLLLNPERGFYLSEAAERVGVAPAVATRHLIAFASLGILHRTKHGREVVYQANRSCPIFPELHSILLKTVGLVDRVRQALASLKGVDVAFVYGSFAEGTERSDSDVDLFVIGQVGLRELTPVLRPLERALGREVNAVPITAEEFQQRLASSDHFVRAVLQAPKLFVRGDQNDLERIAGGGQGERATPHRGRDASASAKG